MEESRVDLPPLRAPLDCGGCGIGGHAYGVHDGPACVSCLRVVDGTTVIGCQRCIDEVVMWAGELVAADDESYIALVRDRLERLREGQL